MTPIQIAYFKHFLFDKGIQSMYISNYKRSRIKGDSTGDKNGNPESIEEFFQQAPYTDVIMHAFLFAPGAKCGYDYWKEIDDHWNVYWDMNENNYNNDKYAQLRGQFAILRQNWDSPRYWVAESVDNTYTRMKMIPDSKSKDTDKSSKITKPKYKTNENEPQQPKFKVGDVIKNDALNEVLEIMHIVKDMYLMSDGGIIGINKESLWHLSDEKPYIETNPDYITWLDDVKKAEEEKEITSEEEEDLIDFSDDFSGVPEADVQKGDSDALLEGFSLVNTTNPRGGQRMKNNSVSVNLRSGAYRITFSAKQSEKLRKGSYKFVKLLTKKETKEIALVFNNQSGSGICINEKSRNVTINSRDVVSSICKFYSTKKDYYKLEITATVQQDLNIIYKLKYLKDE